jgi:hypothetical protein
MNNPYVEYQLAGVYGTTLPLERAQLGWKCPECGRIYAPHIPMCLCCPPILKTGTSTSAEEWNKMAEQTLEHIKNHPPFTQCPSLTPTPK